MSQIIFRSNRPDAFSNFQIQIEPEHLAIQLPMRLKSEIFTAVQAAAKEAFDTSETETVEMMFKFPKRRLPKRCHASITVFARWILS